MEKRRCPARAVALLEKRGAGRPARPKQPKPARMPADVQVARVHCSPLPRATFRADVRKLVRESRVGPGRLGAVKRP